MPPQERNEDILDDVVDLGNRDVELLRGDRPEQSVMGSIGGILPLFTSERQLLMCGHRFANASLAGTPKYTEGHLSRTTVISLSLARIHLL